MRCGLIVVVSAVLAFGAADAIDLGDPRWRAHAELPLHNPPRSQLKLSQGLDFIQFDEVVGNVAVSGDDPLLQLYRKRACQADVIVVGHTTSSAYHLSAFGTAVYGDYVFVIEALLKDNAKSSLKGKREIVVTRPGGRLVLDTGPVTYEFQSFPRLLVGSTYLLVLHYIAESSGYEAFDSSSTLVATPERWFLARKALSNLVVPGFTRGDLENSIRGWVAACR